MIRSRQRLGKYRIGKRIAQGGFADVFEAFDTIEGIPVALKVPFPHLVTKEALEDFRREVRVTARLDHPNILPIKNADFIGDLFVIAYPLGERSLGDRLRSRISTARALSFTEQLLEALAHAHAKKVIHCDVKPDNVILFGDDRIRLTDFGIAKLALRTMRASGSGTVGFVAPEQAMGRPSFRSDVFSAGLILYRMLSGTLPEYPYTWPPPGYERVKKRLHPDLLRIVQRATEMDPYARYADARPMLQALRALGKRAAAPPPGRGARARSQGRTRRKTTRPDWRAIQRREFLRTWRRELDVRRGCGRCQGPVAESMRACPWCGASRKTHRAETAFPASCTRCRRGVKLDWRFCPWCYGGSIGPRSERTYTDRRYTTKCARPACRHPLMPFMRYCPGCNAKVKRPWRIVGVREKCAGCGWGVLKDYWSTCPWCARGLNGRTPTR